jgi:hypothetical protein
MGKLLYIHRVAKALDCSIPIVYKIICEGKLTAVKLSKRGLRITKKSYDQFIIDNTIKPDEFDVEDADGCAQSELDKKSQRFKPKEKKGEEGVMYRVAWCNRRDYEIEGHFKEWQTDRESVADMIIKLNKLDPTHLYIIQRRAG